MRYILFIFVTFLSSYASAANYFYDVAGREASDPSTACTMYAKAAWPGHTIDISGITAFSSNDQATCNYTFTRNDVTNSATVAVSRYGDTCPEGTELNSMGVCAKPENKCDALAGTTTFFATEIPTYEVCLDGCTAAVTDVATYKQKADNKTYYSYSAVYSNEQCSSNSAGSASPAAPPPTSSEKADDCTPTTTNSDGSKSSTCTETVTNIDNQGCVAKGGSVGSIDGVMQCVAANKGPKATETKTSTKQTTSTDQATGLTTVKKETTTTQTSCSGNATCVTNNTTVTNNTKTNADGTSAGGTSTCTGAKCGKDGEAETGEDDAKEEEDEGIEGPTKSLGQGDKGDFTEANTEWDAKVESVKGELSDKIEEYKTLFSGKFDLNLGEGGGKLTCDTFPVDFGRFGSTSIRFCPNDYAEYLVYLKYALILGASVIAAMIILRD